MPIIIGLGWNCILKNTIRNINKNKPIKEEWKKSLESLPFDFLQTYDINLLLKVTDNNFSDIVSKDHLRLKETQRNSSYSKK